MRYSRDLDIPKIKNWHEAFLLLEAYLERCQERRKIVFFDEIPWIETQGSEFVNELEYFWSNWVQNRDDIVFIACGSATNWMKEKLEDNQGGLHNRITHRIYLRPFYLNECKAYLFNHGFDWDDYQILQCYMLFGGVPYYLSLLRPQLSLPQNVDALIFRRGGDLGDEFNELYNALFNKADRYVAIIEEVCLRHLPHIKKGLGISGMATEASSWRFKPAQDDQRKGVQIDLVIKRADKITHLVEMKFSETPFVITKAYSQRLLERKSLFMEITGVARGTVITFVTPKGLSKGMNTSLVHSEITAQHLFAEVEE